MTDLVQEKKKTSGLSLGKNLTNQGKSQAPSGSLPIRAWRGADPQKAARSAEGTRPSLRLYLWALSLGFPLCKMAKSTQ